ncbi:hypothetical protein BDN71DRAFT_1500143 [Pleurotus eryngii]|uniref:Uncharacterized protein n=1 Tax=Pleurotus eryngii TaxID=5323 RepID=A0A9P5ZFJ7_PLEER|nr:hypothetical protein BDN71DRAFT_1500143 [Pleurotus eryngii]
MWTTTTLTDVIVFIIMGITKAVQDEIWLLQPPIRPTLETEPKSSGSLQATKKKALDEVVKGKATSERKTTMNIRSAVRNASSDENDSKPTFCMDNVFQGEANRKVLSSVSPSTSTLFICRASPIQLSLSPAKPWIPKADMPAESLQKAQPSLSQQVDQAHLCYVRLDRDVGMPLSFTYAPALKYFFKVNDLAQDYLIYHGYTDNAVLEIMQNFRLLNLRKNLWCKWLPVVQPSSMFKSSRIYKSCKHTVKPGFKLPSVVQTAQQTTWEQEEWNQARFDKRMQETATDPSTSGGGNGTNVHRGLPNEPQLMEPISWPSFKFEGSLLAELQATDLMDCPSYDLMLPLPGLPKFTFPPPLIQPPELPQPPAPTTSQSTLCIINLSTVSLSSGTPLAVVSKPQKQRSDKGKKRSPRKRTDQNDEEDLVGTAAHNRAWFAPH